MNIPFSTVPKEAIAMGRVEDARRRSASIFACAVSRSVSSPNSASLDG
jgi:hypothetical protein